VTDNNKKNLQDAITSTHQALQVATMSLVSARYIMHHATHTLSAVSILADDELKTALAEFSSPVAQIKAAVDALKALEAQVIQVRQTVAGMAPKIPS
jgi:hypothetical protein